MDQPCFQVDESDVRFICTELMRVKVSGAAGGGSDRLEIEMYEICSQPFVNLLILFLTDHFSLFGRLLFLFICDDTNN